MRKLYDSVHLSELSSVSISNCLAISNLIFYVINILTLDVQLSGSGHDDRFLRKYLLKFNLILRCSI